MYHSDKQRRVVVTGGNGFIGLNALTTLGNDSDSILSIDEMDRPQTRGLQNRTIADITDRTALFRAIKAFKPTHVLHLAAKTGMDLKGLHELTANIDGVRNLIDAAAECGTVKRIVFTSSLLVCRNGYIPKHDEDYCPPNFYGESKMIGEQIVRSADAPFEWAIVRPTSIWGPWFDHSYKTFFETIARGRYFHIGGHNVLKPKSYVGNTVHMMFKILFHPDSSVHRQTYYLSDWPETTTRVWAEEINRQLHGKTIRTVPLSVLRGVARIGDLLKRAGKEPPLTTFRLNNMLIGGSYPVENTRAIVGELPYTLADGVRETIAWMRGQKLI